MRGVVDPPGRGGVTSEHTGVSWGKRFKKWAAKKRPGGLTPQQARSSSASAPTCAHTLTTWRSAPAGKWMVGPLV